MADFPRLLDEASNPRNRMIIALGLYLYLRQSEILTIKVGDVDLADGEVTIHIHKTNDMDVMPISSELDTEIRRYYQWYQDNCGQLRPEWYFVPTLTHHRIGSDEPQVPVPTRPAVKIENAVKAALIRAGYQVTDAEGSTREGLHTLRRSGARALFDELRGQGYDGALRQVQTWLHHAQSTMTERYLGLGLERQLRNNMVKGQPLYKSLANQDVVPIRRVG